MYKIGIIGCGNWGTTVLKVVAENVKNNNTFESTVMLHVKEQIYNNIKLSDYINKYKTNPIYLKDIFLPDNILAKTDLKQFEYCDIIIICLPHQYLDVLKDFKVKDNGIVINLSKGLIFNDNNLYVPSEYISYLLNVKCCSLMGANIASEVAKKEPSSCTIGYIKKEQINILKSIFENEFFKCDFIKFNKGMELCGALKNIISIGFGILEGLNYGYNTRSMFFRMGLIEIKKICKIMNTKFPLLKSCCISDLLTSCLGGRNYKCGKEIITKGLVKIDEELCGQKLQGPETALSIYKYLIFKEYNIKDFPIIETIYKIFYENEKPEIILQILY